MKKTKLLAGGMLLAMATSMLLGITQASTLSFASTATGDLIKNCPVKIDVMMNTEGEEINSASFILLNDDSFKLNEVNTDEGVFRTYTKPKAAVASEGEFKGKEAIRVVGTTASENGFNGDGKFLSLTITPTSDTVNLALYMVKDFNGDDVNLVKVENDEAIDTITSAEPATYKVVEGTCAATALGEITLEEPTITVSAEDIENIVEDTTNLNEENVFDKSQTESFLANNWIYLAIGLVVVIAVVLIAVKSKKKEAK